jgi:hypothetical protein
MICQALKPHARTAAGVAVPIDVHLMVSPVDALAAAFAQAGAAIRLDQAGTSPGALIEAIRSLRPGGSRRELVQSALVRMDQPAAASEIAAAILVHLREPFTQAARRSPSRPRPAAAPDLPGPSPRLIPAKEAP